MIRFLLLTSYLLLVTSARALTDAWSVDVLQNTAVQRTYKQGETWDMAVTLRSGLAPLSLAGATATFCWYTNSVAGLWWTNSAAVSGSTVTAAWTPAMDTGASNYWYWIGIWQAGSTSPLWRVNGTVRLLPSPGFAPNALVPPLRTLDFSAILCTNAPWVAASDWVSGSNALASAMHIVNTGLSARVSSVALSVSNLSTSVDSLASFDLTNRITRWYDPELPTRWAEWDGGTNIVIYRAEVSGTNFVVTLSADFLETGGNTRPAWTTTNWPFTDGGWSGVREGDQLTMQYPDETAFWIGLVDAFPSILIPYTMTAQGTATVSIASFNYATNIEYRYFLPTNAIPPELANLDNLQGWLNNLYAMKSAVTEHVTGGSHTNVSVSGPLAFINTQPTNLVGRVYASNDVLMVEWINQ